jgi:hypothetical protein
VEVIRQDAYCDRLEGAAFMRETVCLTQSIDLLDEQIARSVLKDDGEEKHATFNICSAIIRHGDLYHAKGRWARCALLTLHSLLTAPVC